MPSGAHAVATWFEIALGLVTLVALFFVVAPYGRHTRAGWGPSVDQRLGWVLMECPAVFAFVWFWSRGSHTADTAPRVLLAMWLTHYLYRSFVFPMRIRAKAKRTPVFVVGSAITFNLLNAFVNGSAISEHEARGAEWLSDPRFIVGASLFAMGLAGNIWSDEKLRTLRKPGETGYVIPRGGLYDLISSPNYACEIVEWIGWAIASYSLGGAAFAWYTFANLAPRALSHHRWYREKFADYPPSRKALVPFVW